MELDKRMLLIAGIFISHDRCDNFYNKFAFSNHAETMG